MNTFSQLIVTARRRSTRLAAGGLLAVPLLMQSCQPACAPVTPAPPRIIEERGFGLSVEGRPLIATRLGDPNGVPILAIGSIHGEEQAGIEIVENIRDSATIPAGYDVWVIRTINPDGNIANIHQNRNGVDLNRNFGPNWEPNDCSATPRYCAGSGPLSEPESQAIANFINEIKPRMTVWYHGPLNIVDAATLNGVANPDVLTAYAAASGYGVATVNCNPTGRCVGNATQYLNSQIPGSSSFVVELSSNIAGAMTQTGVNNHTNGFFAAAAAAAATPVP